MGTTTADYYLDGGNVVGEKTGTGIITYLRGNGLISMTSGSTTQYYLHNAHGDVVNLTDSTGASTKAYAYDAFGNEKNQLASDTNPFRYCGEYLDKETNEYYLRARYYDSSLGRFSQADTHWNPGNMIYGDTPQQIGEYRDALGLNRYVYAPQRTAGPQAGNLYIYCINSPVIYVDTTGKVMTYRNLCLEGGPSGGGATVSLSPADAVFGIGTIVLIAAVGQVLLAQSDGQDQTQESAITQSTTASPFPLPPGNNNKDNKQKPNGQKHHLLSNSVIRALNNHKTLRGIFMRNSLIAQAKTLFDHYGYQGWHRDLDKALIAWLTVHREATPEEFLNVLYEFYNKPDMLARFGNEALEAINEFLLEIVS